VSFFERQRTAKVSSVRLVVLFIAAVVGIVLAVDVVAFVLFHRQPPATLAGVLVATSLGMLLIIAGGSISKTLSLRSGGAALAQSLGAAAVDPTTTDPVLRRYVNVVEEIALASGVPMPRLFVMEQEPGINAFAAGYTPADAAITVTGGALKQLNRDELQGVIGHEFSHVLNGDMRLNIRLIGLLNGILLLGLIGLRVLGSGAGRGNRDNNAAPIFVIAIAMLALGFIGQFFASMIKAAVGRQREWLADASSVQFTRNPQGLEGALKKIAGLPTGSQLTNARNAKEVSHMLFGEGSRVSRLFASHPPLMDRIVALDPSFKAEQVAKLQEQWAAAPPNGLAEDAALGLVGATPLAPAPAPTAAPTQVPVQPAQVSGRVGTMSQSDLYRGQQLSARVPQRYRQLAGQASTAVPLVLAMALGDEDSVRSRQLVSIATRLGDDTAAATAQMTADLEALPLLLRLPVVSIAVPALGARPPQQVRALIATLDDMALADGSISVFEYCLTRMIGGYARDVADPSGRSKPGNASVASVQSAATTLVAAIAAAGNPDQAAEERAFTNAMRYLMPSSQVVFHPPSDVWRALDSVWDPLDSLDAANKQRLIEALVVAISDDGQLGIAEAELLRTACGLLHCALPSFVA
jgi:Zn-dependent protease with chaperone function